MTTYERQLLKEAEFINAKQASDGVLFCVTRKGRCYPGKYSVFKVKIRNGQITSEYHLYSYQAKPVVIHMRDLFLKIHNLEITNANN